MTAASLGGTCISDSLTGTSTTVAATTNAVRLANENANGRLSTNGGTVSGRVEITPVANNTNPSQNGLYIYNPNNSVNNCAIIAARVAGSSAGDPYVSWDIANVSGWSMGMDNSDAQKLKINKSWDFTGTDIVIIDSSGNTRFNGSVGVGTSPSTKFHAYVNEATSAQLTLQNADSTNGRAGISFFSGTTSYQISFQNGKSIFQNWSNGNTEWWSSSALRMSLNNDGDLRVEGKYYGKYGNVEVIDDATLFTKSVFDIGYDGKRIVLQCTYNYIGDVSGTPQTYTWSWPKPFNKIHSVISGITRENANNVRTDFAVNSTTSLTHVGVYVAETASTGQSIGIVVWALGYLA
jgi:hypothetical protein